MADKDKNKPKHRTLAGHTGYGGWTDDQSGAPPGSQRDPDDDTPRNPNNHSD